MLSTEETAERTPTTLGSPGVADRHGNEARAGDLRRFEAALDSGAQLISTDFPSPPPGVDYAVDIPGGTPSRCNPLTAPPGCVAEDIEDPSRL